jgi:glycosyltransferase involved in cell wall biosynthesis
MYGGTERVVSYLTEELVRQGHEVTLFASGDSLTSARLVASSPTALRLDPECVDPLAHHFIMLERVFRRTHEFDVVHFHIDYLHFPLSRRTGLRHVSTLHGALNIPDLVPLYREFPEMPVVSISDTQRKPLPWLRWVATVHHGLPPDLYRFHAGPGRYLAFLGRISPEKRVDHAIEIARRTGIPLRIAAKVDKADREYFENRIRPLLDPGITEYLGEIAESEKDELLGGALALLFPIEWREPFGLVLIEALACGTPVVAFDRGAVPEVVRHGRDGFVVRSVDEAVQAVDRIGGLSRWRCRESFEERFTSRRMARDYLAIYERVAAGAYVAPGAPFEAVGPRPAPAPRTPDTLVPLVARQEGPDGGSPDDRPESPRVA